MGPGPDGPGKPADGRVLSVETIQLQWGRGRMAPENYEALEVHHVVEIASMGPGPDGPGKPGLNGPWMTDRTWSFNLAGAGWPRKTPSEVR